MKSRFIVIFILGVFWSCSQKNNTTILFINNSLVDCVGVGPQKCMQIKYQAAEDWQYFYDTIEGFEYESGYFYKLEIIVQNVENPPADASNKKYILVNILDKVLSSN